MLLKFTPKSYFTQPDNSNEERITIKTIGLILVIFLILLIEKNTDLIKCDIILMKVNTFTTKFLLIC